MSKLISIVLTLFMTLNIFGGFGRAESSFEPAYPDYGGSSDTGASDYPAPDTGVSDAPATDAPEVDDSYLYLEDEIRDFLNTPGINGFWIGGGGWPDQRVSLREVVYQLQDEYIAYSDVAEAYKDEGYDLYTDLSYISAGELDYLLWEITGDDLYDYGSGDFLAQWDMYGVTYLEELDVFCVQHGDTNFQPVDVWLLDFDEDSQTAYVQVEGANGSDLWCYVGDTFVEVDFIEMELWRWSDDGMYEFEWIYPYY